MAVIAPNASPPEQHASVRRVVDATLRCVARWGVAKTTLDDIAREAGCSRATVYRLFPGGKEAVLAAVVRDEIARFSEGLAARLAGVDDLEGVLVAGMTFAARWLDGHAALQFLLAHEPELVLPRISFARMNDVLRAVGRIAAPYLVPFVGDQEAPAAAEWVARIVFSYAVCPSSWVDICDDESVTGLVQDFVLPGLANRTTSVQGG